ncbi:hypothetical protein HY086_05590 [Candidatus Gottesmanbacteria bacterium]|nr:hypothetical protein [Candidatus Gottesmanbacteria bacterium]
MDSDRDLLLVSVFTFLTVSLWVFFELVKTTKTTTVTPTVQQVIAPFSSTLETDIVDVLEKKSAL